MDKYLGSLHLFIVIQVYNSTNVRIYFLRGQSIHIVLNTYQSMIVVFILMAIYFSFYLKLKLAVSAICICFSK